MIVEPRPALLGVERLDIESDVRIDYVMIVDLGNPVEGERDSALKPNTIPL